MKNNEYTATPNWFGDTTVSSQQPTSGQTNYYISSTVSGGGSTGGLQSINLYNKFVIKTLRLTIDDLVINDSALIAEDVELEEGQERPEDFVSEIGNIVTDKDWHTSYKFRIIAGTNLVANLKANDKRYGIVFYDNYNQPISGYSPKQDALETIVVPENTRYFRCCHYIEPVVESDESTEEPVELEYEFYIEYRGFDNYDESDLNIAYGSIFEDFINVNQSIPEGIISDALTSTKLNLIFQQPLQYNIDKSGNIKIELDNDLLTNTLGNTYVTTIADNPQDILSQKDFKQGLKVNGINIIEKDGYVYLDGNLVLSGGVTTYSGDGLKVPGLYDGLPIDNITIYWEKDADGNKVLKSRGGGGEGNVDMAKVWEELAANTSEQINESHLTTALSKYPTTSKMWELLKAGTTEQINISHLTEALQSFSVSDDLKNKYVTLDETKQNILGIKNFVNGLELDGQLIKIVDGVLYLDCSVAITGGLTTFALGDRQPSTIMDAIVVDDTTISKEGGVLHLKNGAGGGGDIDEDKLWQLLGSEGINQIHESHLTIALSSYATIEQLNKKWTQDDVKISHWDEAYGWGDHSKQGYAHLAGEEVFTGLKHFTPGITIGSGKHRLYESNGVVYLDGDLAVTGGLTTFALGSRNISTIMDGIVTDEVTITVKNINGAKKLVVIGGTGSDFDKSAMWSALAAATNEPINKSHLTTTLSGYATESWVTSKNYAVKSTTLSGYGITDGYKIISGTPDDNKGMSAGYWSNVGSYASFVSNNWGGQFKMESTEALSYRTIKNGTASAWKNIAFTTSTIDNALHLNGKELNYNSQNPYGKIPFVATDGVMEIGRYIDFHYNSTHTADYSIRLQCNSTGTYMISLPSSGGTLALLTDNVASATKLQNARTIWGKSFNGTANVNGRWELDGNNSGKLSIFDSGSYRSIQSYGGALCMNVEGNNVGIGTSTATYKLTVKGDVGMSDSLFLNGVRLQVSNGYLVIDSDLKIKGNILAEGGVTTYASTGEGSAIDQFSATRFNVVGTKNSDAYISADNTSNMFFNWGNKTGLVLSANEVRCSLNMTKQISLGSSTAVWKDLYVNGLTVNSSPILSDTVMTAIRTDINNAYFGLRHNGTNWYVQGYNGQLQLGPGSTKSVKIDVNGNMSVYGKVTESSDIRLKTDIKPLTNRGYVEPKIYTKDGEQCIGFIAQDVKELYPELVMEDSDSYLSLSYSQYVAVLQAQIIELNERIKKLEQLNN